MGISWLSRKRSRNPETAFAQARQELDDALPLKVATLPIGHEAWACYRRALAAARKCGGDAVTSLVLEFDERFPSERAKGFPMCDPYLGPALINEISSIGPWPLYRALKVLLASGPVTDLTFEAAQRLAIRLGDIDQMRRVENCICLNLATRGDSGQLISKLWDRRNRGLLARSEIEETVSAYLSAHRFDSASLWAAFFEQLGQDELPRNPEVHQLVSQFRGAADAALRHLIKCPGKEAARQAVTLCEQIHNPELAIKAHHHAGEAFYQEADYLTAAMHFLKANDPLRASDCYLSAGRIPDAIMLRQVSPEWLVAVREKMDQMLREFVQREAWLEAIRLVRHTAELLRVRDNRAKKEYIRSEAARLEGVLDSVVRTARASLTEESRNAEPGAEVFRRWSAIEEAAGNFLQAGLQAERGQDYVTAALMFEEAGASAQALHAFDRSSRSDLERRAELLEHDGNFSRAVCLYKRLGQAEKVREMQDMEFEQRGFSAGN